jgi:hypothetical protein
MRQLFRTGEERCQEKCAGTQNYLQLVGRFARWSAHNNQDFLGGTLTALTLMPPRFSVFDCSNKSWSISTATSLLPALPLATRETF